MSLGGRLAPLAGAEAFAAWLRPLYGADWVVYSQPPAAGPEVVLKYLARYVHRVALSNSRLVSVTEAGVSFRWKDYAHGAKEGVLALSGEEFLRRWVQHVLPKGFVKVRHYGLLASRRREEKLAACRWQLLLAGLRAQAGGAAAPAEAPAAVCCPECGSGPWAVVGRVPRPGSGPPADTS